MSKGKGENLYSTTHGETFETEILFQRNCSGNPGEPYDTSRKKKQYVTWLERSTTSGLLTQRR
jgi:hypothetical protein